jgi:hypothetical protein
VLAVVLGVCRWEFCPWILVPVPSFWAFVAGRFVAGSSFLDSRFWVFPGYFVLGSSFLAFCPCSWRSRPHSGRQWLALVAGRELRDYVF